MNAYTTPPGAQSAFIHHGSPVPVQIHLFYELWNRTQSQELLEHFYPRLRQYHRFLAGRLGSSTTRRHRDHLICTWDYFYNSDGWDDYPPPQFVHQQKLETTVAPVVNSSHTIRCAKMLRLAAAALGRAEDFDEYDCDIAELSASLQKYSWDAAAGYFGYIVHDERGRCVYHTTREGRIVDGATSIYYDCLVVYGLSEYCRAVPDANLLALAGKLLQASRSASKHRISPKPRPINCRRTAATMAFP